MKRIVFYLSLVLFAGLLTGCSLLGKSGDPTANSKLQSLSVTGLYANGNQIVAATGNYIFLSVDNGSTWKLVDTTIVRSDSTSGPLPLDNLGFISRTTLFGNGSFIFAGVDDGEHGGILVSTDNGRTWTERDTSFSKAVNCFARIGNTFFAGTGRGVFLSNDYGNNWKASGIDIVDVFSMTNNGSILFAGGPNKGIFRSTDNCKSWSAVDKGLTNNFITSLTTINNNIYAGVFKNPGDSTGGVFFSNNNGSSWSPTNKGLTNHLVNVVYSHGSDLFAGTNGETYFSTDEGNSWSLMDSTITTTCFAANSTYLFEGTHKGVRRYPLSKFNK